MLKQLIAVLALSTAFLVAEDDKNTDTSKEPTAETKKGKDAETTEADSKKENKKDKDATATTEADSKKEEEKK